MQLIGLTGGIATGKSTVSALLAEQGLPVIDADKIAKNVVRKGKWGHKRVVKAFGREILQADGELDRKKLGKLIFESPQLRRKLNEATHPLVTLEMVKQIVDVPLLFEGGLHRYAAKRITVACSPAVQLQRLMARDGSTKKDAYARIASQMPLGDKIALSEIVVNNDGTPEDLISRVESLGGALKAHQAFRGLLSSPLAVLFAALALFSVARRHFMHSVYGPGAATRNPFLKERL